jgi:hypothetical protein
LKPPSAETPLEIHLHSREEFRSLQFLLLWMHHLPFWKQHNPYLSNIASAIHLVEIYRLRPHVRSLLDPHISEWVKKVKPHYNPEGLFSQSSAISSSASLEEFLWFYCTARCGGNHGKWTRAIVARHPREIDPGLWWFTSGYLKGNTMIFPVGTLRPCCLL